MTSSEFLKPWKTHVGFAAAFLAILFLNLILKTTAGEPFSRALGHAFTAVTPVEYLMFAGLWYSLAFSRPSEVRRSAFTSLNLSEHKT
jgi:hypothetical protein